MLENSKSVKKIDHEKIKAEEFKKQSRQDWKKQKELEEARKAGAAPAELDEDGNEINPHIPQFIVQTPWYLGIDKPTLRHQRTHAEKQKQYASIDEDHHPKGVQKDSIVTRFRKGACSNCGSTTHTRKSCMERPRRVGAKWSQQNFQPDEYIAPKISKSFEGKRDRWAGYNPAEYKSVVNDYAQFELAKQRLRAEEVDTEVATVPCKKEGDDKLCDDDEYKITDETDMCSFEDKWDAKKRGTIPNLRIREDTAKYLYNLDPNSAYYDAKSRSMREDPFANTTNGKDIAYKGDNFIRYTGEAAEISNAHVFAWEATERSVPLHLMSEPTKLELMKNQYEKRKEEVTSELKTSIFSKYGGEEYLEVPSKSLLMSQTENYVEYSRQGRVIKGQTTTTVKSIYEEDIYPNNHKSVWGSYWVDGQWGYKCCHSLVKQSYCTGEAGRQISKDFLKNSIK